MSVKRTKKTDGVFTFVETRVDLTKPRKGDPTIREMLHANTPEARIQSLETFAASVDSTAPFVAMRVEQLRDYIARARRAFAGGNGVAGLARIRNATDSRQEIMALPYALKGIRREESDHKKTETARKAKGRPAEARRELLKVVANDKGWKGSTPVSMSEWKTIRRVFRTTHPQYKKYELRVHNEDAVTIGLRPRKKTSTTK